MHINYYQKLEFKRKLHTFNMNPYTNILTVLAVTCKDSIVNYSKLIQLVITNFELNFKEPTHSAKQSFFFFFFEFLLIIQNPDIGKNKIQKKKPHYWMAHKRKRVSSKIIVFPQQSEAPTNFKDKETERNWFMNLTN